MADRAEGRLRGDLLTAALAQPLERLSEQAVGEIIDRVDDDAAAVGALARHQVWDAMRTVTYACCRHCRLVSCLPVLRWSSTAV